MRESQGAAGSTGHAYRGNWSVPSTMSWGQLDILARTVGVLEQRLALTEDRLQRGGEVSPGVSGTAVRGRY